MGKRLLTTIVAFLVGAGGMALLPWLYGNGHVVVFPSKTGHLALLSIFLGAATLVIATVTVLLALGAVVGYGYIKEAAVQSGRVAGANAAETHLAPLRKRLDDLLTAAESGVDRTDALRDALAENGNRRDGQ